LSIAVINIAVASWDTFCGRHSRELNSQLQMIGPVLITEGFKSMIDCVFLLSTAVVGNGPCKGLLFTRQRRENLSNQNGTNMHCPLLLSQHEASLMFKHGKKTFTMALKGETKPLSACWQHVHLTFWSSLYCFLSFLFMVLRTPTFRYCDLFLCIGNSLTPLSITHPLSLKVEDGHPVFYLWPRNKKAWAVVQVPENCFSLTQSPAGHKGIVVRFKPRSKNILSLARFGRRDDSDIHLPTFFSRSYDQCLFAFNADSGELMLYDLSPKNDTELFDLELGKAEDDNLQLLCNTPRQCAVVLRDGLNGKDVPSNRHYKFRIGGAEFNLDPAPSIGRLAMHIAALASLPADPSETKRSSIAALQSLRNAGTGTAAVAILQRVTRRSPRATSATAPQPEDGRILYTKMSQLGAGGQGTVYKVVDLYTGMHLACKIVRPSNSTDDSKKRFRRQMANELHIVKSINHVCPHFTFAWSSELRTAIPCPVSQHYTAASDIRVDIWLTYNRSEPHRILCPQTENRKGSWY
jgi:hypothetical protein